MTFHRPFDRAQLANGWTMYRKMRANLRTIRRTHAPRTIAQKRSLDLYRVAIQRFGEQLLKPPAKINAELMNELCDRAVDAFLIYLAAYRAGE